MTAAGSLLGVVAPFAGTSTVSSGGPWTARVRLVCAQWPDGTVTAQGLTLASREVAREEAARIVEGLRGYDVVRCEVDGRTLLGPPEPAETTPELAAALERLRRPVVVEHALGSVAWTLESEAFDGELLPGIEVRLDTGDPTTARRLLEELATALSGGLAEQIADRAATLLDLANDEWLDGDEPRTAEDFRRLRFAEWAIDEHGGFEAYADDDGIFAGHAVVVQGTLADGATVATIAG